MTFWLRRRGRAPEADRRGFGGVPASAAALESLRGAVLLSPGSVDIRLPNRVELSVSVGTDSAWVSQLLQELLHVRVERADAGVPEDPA